MANLPSSFLRSLVSSNADSPSDGELLDAFVSERNESAFSELIKRHSPLVFSVSRRLLNQTADAEDVCQAVFLILARKANTLGNKRSVAGWLYCVTRRVA